MNYYSLISSMSKIAPIIWDADALTFISNASITNDTQKSAINTLVTDLKSANIWSKMKAIYPFVGGTASQHKFNLKDPRDDNSAFRLTFSGGGTHTSNGYVMNGTDSYANTFFNPSLISGWKDNHNISIYLNTSTPYGGGWHIGYGDTLTGNPLYGLAVRRSLTPDTDKLIYDSGNISQYGRIFATISDAKGLWAGNARTSSIREIYKNNTVVSSNYLFTVIGTPQNDVMTIGGIVSGITQYFLSGINSFTAFSSGMNNTEASNFYTAVQTYQATLGRAA